jgi:hypothetical protein
MSFVLPVIMDQVETLPVASDVDSQYDVLVFLSHIVGQLTGTARVRVHAAALR